ncbi:MAG: exopolysaccharide Pel transporter PelG [Magnetococcales bacterium]|nr:exopolysaccharide Pel transporter PelG [Magnetococcales bacterium]
MAGIGFVLRNLTNKDDLSGLLSGFAYSALIATGPWLFTIVALTGILTLGSLFTTFEQQIAFRVAVIYNFSFSLVISGPIVMVLTRHVADLIYLKEVDKAPGALVGGLILVYAIQLPIAVFFYFYYLEMDFLTAISAFINYFLINGIWVASIFVTALKDYKTVMRVFLLGMTMGAVSNPFLSKDLGVLGMYTGFNAGLVIILFGIIARVFAEYPYDAKNFFGFMHGFRRYWDLALVGFTFNLAAWADKWIMWFAPEREVLAGGFISYSNYDSAMFLAYLTIVPSMASFVLSMETRFYEHYLKYYRDIQKHANLKVIQANHQELIQAVQISGRNFIILQGGVSLLAILLAPKLFVWLDINFKQLAMFRLGALGAFYHVSILFLNIVLSYFDCRTKALQVSLIFLFSNILMSSLSMHLGFPYYGYGYFGACLITFMVALIVTFRHLLELPYHTFITQNESVSGG